MYKRCVLFLALVMVVLVAFSSQAIASKMTKITIQEGMQREKLINPNDLPYTTGQGIPFQPGAILDSPGELVGTSHYDYQTNSSTGNRVVKDDMGGVHVVWMNGIDFWSGNRWVYYNFKEETGAWIWPAEGTQVNTTQGAGYTQLVVLADGRAVPVYHSSGNDLFTCIGLDVLRGFGSFTEIDVPQVSGEFDYYWPYATADRSDRIHIVSTEMTGVAGDPHAFIYTSSADEGNSWSDPEIVDTTMDLSSVMTSSRVSDKVCIAYTRPRTLIDPNQYNNDMVYIESVDGTTWDWADIVNVTNYQYEDTLRAYCDCDAVYDYNDNLHLLWNTPYYDEAGGFISVAECLLWHWSEATGLNLVANGWWVSAPGAWNRSISKMSLGVNQNNVLFALWTQFTDDDKSVAAWSNGELYTSYSTNGGVTWSTPENITNTPTPDCWPGECDSDHWSTLGEEVDENLHIIYTNDKDAGGIPQTEGVDTENPMMY
ncbi:MAG: sialidase family protein, partial [Candidatus Zixiibacteriota bacterium]